MDLQLSFGHYSDFTYSINGTIEKRRKIDRYNILRKGKVIFWDVTERELFDIMEDLAVETYYNKDLKSTDITYEPAIHLDEKTHQSEN